MVVAPLLTALKVKFDEEAGRAAAMTSVSVSCLKWL